MARTKYNWQLSPHFGVCEICGINDNIEAINPEESYYISHLPTFKCCTKCGFSYVYDLKKRGLKQISISWSKFNLKNWNYDKKGNRRGDNNEAVGASN
tara:strand:- start:544 stop:837 length:294 start_codon:yes stop_codon:yes gene_type:complete